MNSESSSGTRAILKLSAIYDWVQKSVVRKPIWVDVLQELLPYRNNGLKVLDIGCGTGNFLAGNYEGIYPENYVGIDPSENYIKSAIERFPRASFHRGVVGELFLPDEQFDLVVFSGVLHHLNDSEALEALQFADAKAVKGGLIVSVDPVIFRGQKWLAKRVALADRGQHVRGPDHMRLIWERVFDEGDVDLSVKEGYLKFSYNHIVCSIRKQA